MDTSTTYALGIDLGTTYTSAAVVRDGRAEIATLGSRAAVIPSVVLLRDDDTFLTGETADRRALTEPQRVAREFKRRLGDPTPLLLGGAPYSAEGLTARLLRAVIDEVAAREGGEPSAVCICHPANWGRYKLDLLEQAVRMAGMQQPVTYVSEPEAAAAFYALGRPVAPGGTVGVYDLGGGTFDAAVLRRTETGFTILGRPEGVERLGGIDIDAAVLDHVRRATGGALDDLDPEDAAAVAAVARLREECVSAKEALSSDTDVTIPVILPGLSTEVRLTRAELEAMVRPLLLETVAALRRALTSAGVAPEELDAVLLVGGSSRIPLVAQLVGAELGRPVAVDVNPKHVVALGAAWLALAPGAAAPAVPDRTTTGVAVAAVGAASHAEGLPPAGDPREQPAAVAAGVPGGPSAWQRLPRAAQIAVGAALAVVLGVGAWALVPWPGQELAAAGPDDAGSSDSPTPSGDVTPSASPEPTETEPELPPAQECSEEILANERWVCLTSATVADGELVVEYEAEWAGGVPDEEVGFHVHFYGADETGTDPEAAVMGTQATHAGSYFFDAHEPVVRSVDSVDYVMLGDAPLICGRIAFAKNHKLVSDADGGYDTGNCWPIERT
ncbi:Hsp70 family protein [Myceligenerans xiligouense]|uniref:Hsp70 protein n=1 Tax=Myceligenerans xiligouense TaxID=253184 RepID=A0A3N4YLH6_9MICO|nr:Hsp70 family protein [Myceligenerans xiligouense]RPF20967.1 Hsp70 protein [Myceligenerans xiligouense]